MNDFRKQRSGTGEPAKGTDSEVASPELKEATQIESDAWRTFKRVWPRDVHEEIKSFEALVAEHSGYSPRFQGIGPSVEVWAIIAQHLRDTKDALVELAKEKRKED